MAESFGSRFRKAFNLLTKEDDGTTPILFGDFGSSYSPGRPDRTRMTVSGDRSVISSIYTQLGMDVAAIDIRHIKVDANGRFTEGVNSGLNNCLTLEANIDQGSRAFKQDLAMTLFDKGVVAIVPVDTTDDPDKTNAFDVLTLRVGEIVEWRARHIKVRVWNDRAGKKQEVWVSKEQAAVVENPLYSVMNEPNGTLQRLIRKLSLLDAIDEQSGSGKLDMIIQLPYVIKTDARRLEAEKRRKDIELQLKGSQYGIAYTDGTEKITQLNRPAENNLLAQIEYLTTMLFNQLGLSEEVFKGTASEAAMLNYQNRTIEPIVAAITQAMKRTFLTKTARTQGQSIEYFREPFKLVPVEKLADFGDKFVRNEILSKNEMRGLLGFRPAADAKADELSNPNMPIDKKEAPAMAPGADTN